MKNHDYKFRPIEVELCMNIEENKASSRTELTKILFRSEFQYFAI